MSNTTIIRHTNIDEKGMIVDCAPSFLFQKEAKEMYSHFSSYFVPFVNNRRQSKTFGDDGLEYEIKIKNNTIRKKTEKWSMILFTLKTRLEVFLKETYGITITFNICVIQRYPSGKYGIAPHRDKEMTLGTIICGISLGQTRTLEISKYGRDKPLATIPLPPGSLYMLHPPTNSYCTHSIPKDSSYEPRISLTFRNYRG